MKSRIVVSLTMVAIFMFMASSVSAQPPRVNVMPGNEPGWVYPYAWPGRVLTIWGNVHDGTPPYTYVWEFGDGTPPASGVVTNPKYISVTHAYATMGPKLAVLTVTDATSLSDQDTVEIEVVTKEFHVEVNASIEDGLRWLYLQQDAGGRWTYSGFVASPTAMALLTFENNRHLPINDINEDIYAEYVQAGLDYLFTTFYSTSVPVQGAGDPEEDAPGNTDHNGIGIGVNSSRNGYETGMAMMAIVGSGPLVSPAPDLVSTTGPANVIGRTYRDIVIDMVDWCAWAQVEPSRGYYRGGWRYTPNYSSSDNSVSQWPAIGLEAAETNWGIAAPSFVKSELLLWLSASQRSGGSYDGAFWYSNYWPYSPIGVTGAGLCELSYADVPNTDPRVTRTIAYLARDWSHSQNVNNRYNLYAVAKGCRIAVDASGDLSEIVHINGYKWYDNYYAPNLMAIQQGDGGWPSQWGRVLSTAWAVLVLQKTVVGCHPVAVIEAPASVPPDFPFEMDAAKSYIQGNCPGLRVVEWLWDFDKSDGVDWDNPDAVGIHVVNPGYSLPGVIPDTFLVTLRVADNSDSVLHDIEEHTVIVNFENHPPVADAGGPYAAHVGEVIAFDGTGSYDPDSAIGDYIVSYSWDIDGDDVFSDCSDSVCQFKWDYVYSGYVGLVVTDTYGATSDTAKSYVKVWTSHVDVGLEDSDISFSKAYPQPADLITITAIVHCDDESDPVSDVLVRFYDGDPDIVDRQIGDDQIIPSMVAGDAIPVQVSYVVGDTLPRLICVRVDPDPIFPGGDLEEYNEHNNEAFREIKKVMPCIIDIKPQSCPNPFRTKAKGVLPVAILGTEDFDATTVDPATVLLEGVAPLRDSLEDVSRPVDPREDVCDCTADTGDGYLDMTLKFDHREILMALEPVSDGEVRVLTLTGTTIDGIPIEGQDCVVIIHKGPAKLSAETPTEFSLSSNYPNPFNPVTQISFTLPRDGYVKLEIYNLLGQKVATLVDEYQQAGQKTVSWEAKDFASGIYFYKLSASDFTATKKMVLTK